jgi:peptidoglycan/xylan/chitin deacetylase (PgdA/CDA1 family)
MIYPGSPHGVHEESADMDVTETGSQNPWDWPESVWRKVARRVSAGPGLIPKAWPGAAPFAVALSFDSDHETIELREGGRSINKLSIGEYGARRGIVRITEILEKANVPASFFVPAVSALLHPEQQELAVLNGHEVGVHGWIHELNTKLPRDAERDLMMRAADVLEKITGSRPRGLRTASWDFSDETLRIATEMGLLYDSSLMADDDCYELLLDGKPTGVVELPVQWIRDDAVYFGMDRMSGLRPYTPPRSVVDIFLDELKLASEERGIFQLTLHPHIIGVRSRIWILKEVIDRAKELGAWFGTHAQIVEYVKDNGFRTAD